ncbi:hypothetical protein HWV62_15096 [Athelia sp. TMB]|nr:hypothetical protein HWV62_15096 [Athelia sp. TMB]
MSTTARQPTSPVFVKNPKADIILRSADNVDFYARKSLLSYASSVFESMFEIPAPVHPEDEDEIKGGRRVIQLVEDSVMLERVLLFCYPRNVSAEPVDVGDLETAVILLRALDKYDMEDSYRCVLTILSTSPLVKDDPLRAFGVACRIKDRKMAKFASRFLERSKVHQTVHKLNPDYDCFTFLELLRAEEYREKCFRALELKNWKKEFAVSAFFHEGGPKGEWPYGACSINWREIYLANVAKALRDNPCGAVAHDREVQAPLKGLQCKQCSEAAETLPIFVSAFIERALGEVSQPALLCLQAILTRNQSFYED